MQATATLKWKAWRLGCAQGFGLRSVLWFCKCLHPLGLSPLSCKAWLLRFQHPHRSWCSIVSIFVHIIFWLLWIIVVCLHFVSIILCWFEQFYNYRSKQNVFLLICTIFNMICMNAGMRRVTPSVYYVSNNLDVPVGVGLSWKRCIARSPTGP